MGWLVFWIRLKSPEVNKAPEYPFAYRMDPGLISAHELCYTLYIQDLWHSHNNIVFVEIFVVKTTTLGKNVSSYRSSNYKEMFGPKFLQVRLYLVSIQLPWVLHFYETLIRFGREKILKWYVKSKSYKMFEELVYVNQLNQSVNIV
jgi:hypothetical protein